MGVTKPKNSPYWHYAYQIKGFRLRGTTKETNKRRAQIVAEKARRNYLDFGHINAITINEAFGKFYVERASSERNHRTVDYQLDNLRVGLGKRSRKGNELCLHEINRPLVNAYIQWRKVQPSRRGGYLSASSINAEIRLLRRVLNTARQDWGNHVDRDLSFRDIFLKEPHQRARALTSDEQVRLHDELQYHALWPVVRFSIATTQRQQSVLKLEWHDVDFQNRTVTFRDVKSKRNGKVHVLPLTSEMIEIIAPLRGDHPRFVFTYECRRSVAKPKREKGKHYPFSQSGWRRDWKKALEAAGIKDFRWHDLRHTGATMWVRHLGLAKTQKITGHADIQSLARYSHLEMEDIREDMEGNLRKIP